MDTPVIINPGNTGDPVDWSNGDNDTSSSWNTDREHYVGCLLNDEPGYIVDTSGNRLILNGGFAMGDYDTSATWQTGDMV